MNTDILNFDLCLEKQETIENLTDFPLIIQYNSALKIEKIKKRVITFFASRHP